MGYSTKGPTANVKAYMERLEPWASGSKDKTEEQGGVYTDAVLIHGDVATYCYHGNPIAQYNAVTGQWLKSTCGWDTVTTRARLNGLPGKGIWRNKGKSYTAGGEWRDDDLDLTHWKKQSSFYWPPLTAIAGASNTGNWSDSPAKDDDCQREVQAFQAFLRKNKVPSSIAWGRTTNIFCVKVYVQVHPKHHDKARELLKQHLSETKTELLHDIWRD